MARSDIGGTASVDGIAVDHGVRGNRHRRFSAERQRAAGRRLDGSLFVAERDVRATDRDRCRPVRVTEDDAHFRSTDAGADDLTQCLVREVHVRRRRKHLAWRRGDRRRGRRRTPGVDHEGRKRRSRRRRGRLWTADFRGRPRADPAIGEAALRERLAHAAQEDEYSARAAVSLISSPYSSFRTQVALRVSGRDSTPAAVAGGEELRQVRCQVIR